MRFLPRLLMLVSLAAPLAHAELLDDVHQRGALRIALEGTYPPFNFKQGGKLTGFETELGELLAAELEVKPEFVTTEWSGILAGLQSGKYDIALNQVSVNEQRRKVFDFSEPYTPGQARRGGGTGGEHGDSLPEEQPEVRRGAERGAGEDQGRRPLRQALGKVVRPGRQPAAEVSSRPNGGSGRVRGTRPSCLSMEC